jgi:uncharacterized glyoxalase superfamily protein PhnB
VKLQTIVYVSDMGRALDFYTALGLYTNVVDRATVWAEMTLGDAVLALHTVAALPAVQVGRVALSLVTETPLEQVVERLGAGGIVLEQEITDEAFGRSIQVRDPDGLVIQINEHDVSLYT